MIISTDLLYKIYPTLIDQGMCKEATNRTCNLLNPLEDDECYSCPLYSGNSVPGYSCSLYKEDNPDLDKSWALFYETYPEYLI